MNVDETITGLEKDNMITCGPMKPLWSVKHGMSDEECLLARGN